ncbi:MAG: hypothetical protein IPO63_05175 [Bacteroidetes bacterium]|nr:hypothetical protein [Bacteroidota bacterium]
MRIQEFNALHFISFSEEQKERLREYFQLRQERGEPSRFQILRRLVRTKAFTRSVYPPDWKVS